MNELCGTKTDEKSNGLSGDIKNKQNRGRLRHGLYKNKKEAVKIDYTL